MKREKKFFNIVGIILIIMLGIDLFLAVQYCFFFIWKYDCGCFLKCFYVEMYKNNFFYFLKITFEISTLK
jgi:hypothetical protein